MRSSYGLQRGIPSLVVFAAISALLLLNSCPSHGQRKDNPAAYACDSKTFNLQDAGNDGATLASPNKRKQLIFDEHADFSVLQGKKRIGRISLSHVSCCIEAGWAPDSLQFFVMWSGGGGVGEYYVRAFRIEEDKIAELSAPKKVAADFKKNHSCESRSNNLFVLGWTPDSAKIFLVPEVYPTGDCKQLGLFRGYLMDAKTDAIVSIFGEKETDQIKKLSRDAHVVVLPHDSSPHTP
jgi:hypothetical protein